MCQNHMYIIIYLYTLFAAVVRECSYLNGNTAQKSPRRFRLKSKQQLRQPNYYQHVSTSTTLPPLDNYYH